MMKALTAIALLLALSELCERTSARSELCANGIILERRNRRSYAPRGERSALNARTGRRRAFGRSPSGALSLHDIRERLFFAGEPSVFRLADHTEFFSKRDVWHWHLADMS